MEVSFPTSLRSRRQSVLSVNPLYLRGLLHLGEVVLTIFYELLLTFAFTKLSVGRPCPCIVSMMFMPWLVVLQSNSVAGHWNNLSFVYGVGNCLESLYSIRVWILFSHSSTVLLPHVKCFNLIIVEEIASLFAFNWYSHFRWLCTRYVGGQ